MPPICGWTFEKPAGKICEIRAGANTDHAGSGFCVYHEWQATFMTERALTRSTQMNVARNIVYQRTKFFGEPIDISPHEAIMQEIQRTAAIVLFLEEHLKDMEDDGTPRSAILSQGTKMGVVPSVWYQLFIEERKHLVAVSATAIKAGVAERKVRIAEQQAAMFAAAFMAFMHDTELALTPEQMVVAPQIARRHLMALNPGPQSGEEQPIQEILDAEVVE